MEVGSTKRSEKTLILEKAVSAEWGGICWQGPWGRWGWGDNGNVCDRRLFRDWGLGSLDRLDVEQNSRESIP